MTSQEPTLPDPGTADIAFARDTDIAIVGIGARFPDAADLAEFRANLAAGRDSVGPMPPERIAATGLDDTVTYLPMGHLAEIDGFDYRFFGLSRREACVIDPQQRLALVLAQRAIEDAGYSTAQLARSVTAVALSAAQSSYHSAAVDPGPLSLLGNATFAGPARIAHRFGFTGACFGIDSGCNSALVAVHQACRELRGGDADYALAGGVIVRVHGSPSWGGRTFSEIMSPSGTCRAFDADADGTVNGEGGAILLLTTVGRAMADRAPIHAVIRGSATRHNGAAAAAISTPSVAAQRGVIEKAWQTAGLDPRTAGYLETHGSGTRLGDAVELESITAVFGGGPGLPIGSVKTNIGHLDHASGIAGLVKAVLSVSRAQLYPSLHFARPTGGFDLAAAGIEVITEARPWTGATVRAAGVSSFSLGGSIAHCVVSQAPSVPADPPSHRARLIGVSARSPEALSQLCAQLAEAVRTTTASLDEVAATLALGRNHYEYRAAVSASGTAQLADALDKAAVGEHLSPTAPRVVLLLSPDAVPVAATAATARPSALPAQLPATGTTATVLAGQIAVHERLTACGIPLAALLSAGSSRFAARYLLGSRDLVDAAELADAPPTIDSDRLLDAVRTLMADGPVVFVEPSRDGRLAALVADAVPEADIVAATADTADLDELLGRLYEYGVDLDWSVVAPARARRVRLPGHPMRESRCWVDLPRDSVPATAPVAASAAPRDHSDPVRWLRETLADLLYTDDEIAEDADYFALGGNSLIAVQLVDRIEEAYGFRPKLLDVYERPRLADFAELLAAGPAGSAARAPIPALVAHDEPVMSSGQERMWFHHQFDPRTTLYNYPVVQLLRGPIDLDALHGTFDDLVQRHETLRYNFAEVDGTAVLRIRDRLDDYFRRVDVSAEPDPLAAARALVHAAAKEPFDLAEDSLLRVLVITVGPDTHVLQLTCHHAVTDGATPVILSRELPELYTARREGRPHRLPSLPIRYRDYAAWHRALLASSALDHELDYWRDALADAPLLRLPTDFPRPARKTYVGDLHPFTIPAALLTDLRALAGRESVSLFVVLLSAFYLTLARYSGQRDIVVGTPTTGRGRREFQDLIGYFNSTVALRTDFSDDTALSDLLSRVRSIVFGALEHQEIPFDRVVNALGRQRDLSRTPLFDVLYIHQVTPRMERIDEAGAELFDLDHSAGNEFGGLPTGTAKFDLTLVTFEYTDDVPRDIGACLEFSTELFTPQTVAAIGNTFLEILTAMVADTGAPPVEALISGSRRDADAAAAIPTDRPCTGDALQHHETISRAAELAGMSAEQFDAALFDTYAVLLTWYSGRDRLRIGLPDSPERTRSGSIVTIRPDTTWRGLRADPPVSVADAGPPPLRYLGHRPNSTPPVPDTSTELALSWTRHPTQLHLHYSTELFDRSSAETMADELVALLRAARRRPDEPVHDTVMGVESSIEQEQEIHP
ncbi:condensation domain-containing protein [Nocardia abscessus]|uniref:condensation domain-containing protein n=1 Tax=Nocardia abscessus TaxID=120957 RepID=UPI002455B22B|nr:condensation domain-containing protein [Nocardia abscessus]